MYNFGVVMIIERLEIGFRGKPPSKETAGLQWKPRPPPLVASEAHFPVKFVQKRSKLSILSQFLIFTLNCRVIIGIVFYFCLIHSMKDWEPESAKAGEACTLKALTGSCSIFSIRSVKK